MYQGDIKTGEDAKKLAREGYPFGPGFSEAVVARTTTVEVWHSSFEDPGGDFNLFRAFDANGEMIAEKKLGGY